MTDYILVITMYPSVLMMHHKYIKSCESKYLCCCCYNGCNCSGDGAAPAVAKGAVGVRTMSVAPETPTTMSKDVELAAAKPKESDPADAGETTNGSNGDGRASAVAAAENESEQQYRCVERYFGVKWTQIILKAKYPILLVFVIIFAICVWGASQLEAVDESEDWFFEVYLRAHVSCRKCESLNI